MYNKKMKVSVIKNVLKKGDSAQKSSLINLALKPLSMILGLIYTPLLLNYLGDSKYGLWSTILSIISWVNYCDIGIGHGLRNMLTRELTNEKYKQAKKSISTAYVILTVIAIILLLVCLLCVCKFDWYAIFNTDIDMRAPLTVSFLFICVNFVLSLSNFILYALQLSEKVAMCNCLVQILNIIGMLILRLLTTESLIWVSILFGATSTIVYIGNTIQILKRNSILTPSIREFERDKVKEISNIGVKFFIIQLACLVLYRVDNLLIINMYGADIVTPFNMVYKIFNTCYSVIAAFCVPYWSKTTQAYEQRDVAWMKKSMKVLDIFAVVFIIGFVILAFIFKPLAYLWLGRSLNYTEGLISVMCIYYCLYTIVEIKTSMINGTGKINFQLILMIFMGALKVPLSVFFAKNCEFGVVGVQLATTLLMLIAAIAFTINLRIIVKKVESKKV